MPCHTIYVCGVSVGRVHQHTHSLIHLLTLIRLLSATVTHSIWFELFVVEGEDMCCIEYSCSTITAHRASLWWYTSHLLSTLLIFFLSRSLPFSLFLLLISSTRSYSLFFSQPLFHLHLISVLTTIQRINRFGFLLFLFISGLFFLDNLCLFKCDFEKFSIWFKCVRTMYYGILFKFSEFQQIFLPFWHLHIFIFALSFLFNFMRCSLRRHSISTFFFSVVYSHQIYVFVCMCLPYSLLAEHQHRNLCVIFLSRVRIGIINMLVIQCWYMSFFFHTSINTLERVLCVLCCILFCVSIRYFIFHTLDSRFVSLSLLLFLTCIFSGLFAFIGLFVIHLAH